MFNGLAWAAEAKQSGDETHVVFSGAGVRWPAELTKLNHPANNLYQAVRESVVGVSCGCAAFFEATESTQACGLDQIKDHPLPGTPGLASLRRYLEEDWKTLIL